MKPSKLFVIISGLISLAANVLAVLSFFSQDGMFAGWRLDPGLLVALSFVLMAYSLTTWSALSWRWAQARAFGNKRQGREPAAFLLNALATFPLLTIWLAVLFSVAGLSTIPTPQRWLLALGSAWGATPFIALGLTTIGKILGPMVGKKNGQR